MSAVEAAQAGPDWTGPVGAVVGAILLMVVAID